MNSSVIYRKDVQLKTSTVINSETVHNDVQLNGSTVVTSDIFRNAVHFNESTVITSDVFWNAFLFNGSTTMNAGVLQTEVHFNASVNMTDFNTTLFQEPIGNPLIVLAVPLLMFLSGVFGNVLALIVLCRSNREHRRNVFFRLVGGLACTDLLGILVVSPVTICVYANGRKWIGGQPLCNYFSFFMIFAGIATVSIVGVMAFERYVSILQPYSYHSKFTPRKVIYILVTVWILSAFVACLPFLGLGKNVLHFPGTWCFFDYYGSELTDKIFTYFYTFFGLFVIGVTAICNTAVMCVLVRMRHLVKKLNKHGNQAQVDNEAHMIVLLAGIILVFATCYAPLMVSTYIS